jgi:hypothetical protein
MTSKAIQAGLLITTLWLPGCATILNSDTVLVFVKSEPQAKIEYGGVEYKTPAIIPVMRSGNNQLLTLRTDGEEKEIELKATYAPQRFLNAPFLFLGIIFLAVDDLSGYRGRTVKPTDIIVNFKTGCLELDGEKSGEAEECKPKPKPAIRKSR